MSAWPNHVVGGIACPNVRAGLLLTLAVCSFTGGCSPPKQQARHPSEQAVRLAESGETEAQCKVGWSYLMDKNYVEAAKWLQRAADAGNINSTGAAGMLFIEGRGVPRDVQRGIRYFRHGAESPDVGGNGECASDLAKMYTEGRLVPRDPCEAYYYFGVAIANCPREDSEKAKDRQRLKKQRKSAGAELTADQRQVVDDRVNTWIANWKKSGCEWLDGP
jgi:Sel1 repeat